jgi:hypothetical protein
MYVSNILQYGTLSRTGHTFFVARGKDTRQIHNEMPLPPQELDIIVIQRKNK